MEKDNTKSRGYFCSDETTQTIKVVILPSLPAMYKGYKPIKKGVNFTSAIITLYQKNCKIKKCKNGIHRAQAFKFQVDKCEWEGQIGG